MTQIALIVDTNSNYSDVWTPCFDRLNRHCKDIKKYVFTDTAKDVPEELTPILYNNDESYRNQFFILYKTSTGRIHHLYKRRLYMVRTSRRRRDKQ